MLFFRRALALAIALASVACVASEGPVSPSFTFRDLGLADPVSPPLAPLAQIVVPTYEGSGQAVHPDVLWFPGGWHGFEYWMAFTPYPGGEVAFENPSIAVSHDGKEWQIPDGLTNPIVPPTKGGYNSDPDLSYDAATDRLVLLAREVRGGFNRVSMSFSSDGVTWSAPRKVFLRLNHRMISPTMVLTPGRDPRLWFVDGGGKRCPKRVTRVLGQEGIGPGSVSPAVSVHDWGPIRPAGLSQPGYFIWHIDIAWVPGRSEYWAVYPAYPRRGCDGDDLFFARSADGLNWTTYATPVLRHAESTWTSFMLYRASTLYDTARDVIRFYLSAASAQPASAASGGPDWRLGMVEFKFADLLARLEREPARPSLSRKVAPAPVEEDALP